MYSKTNEIPLETDKNSINREIFTHPDLMGSFQWAFLLQDKCNTNESDNISLLYKDACFYEYPRDPHSFEKIRDKVELESYLAGEK